MFIHNLHAEDEHVSSENCFSYKAYKFFKSPHRGSKYLQVLMFLSQDLQAILCIPAESAITMNPVNNHHHLELFLSECFCAKDCSFLKSKSFSETITSTRFTLK